MLKIIEPQSHSAHREAIGSLLDLLKIDHGFCLPPEIQDKATFLVAENDQFGVYGGAVLYPRKLGISQDRLRNDTRENQLKKVILSFQPQCQEFWHVRLCLAIGENKHPTTFQMIELYESFYKKLYKAFTDFVEAQGVKFLFYSMRTTDYLNKRAYGYWPFLTRLEFKDPPGGFTYGFFFFSNEDITQYWEVRMVTNPPPWKRRRKA